MSNEMPDEGYGFAAPLRRELAADIERDQQERAAALDRQQAADHLRRIIGDDLANAMETTGWTSDQAGEAVARLTAARAAGRLPTADEVLVINSASRAQERADYAADGHVYLSEDCAHGLHVSCGNGAGLRTGPWVRSCRYCQALCSCDCHGGQSSGRVDEDGQMIIVDLSRTGRGQSGQAVQ